MKVITIPILSDNYSYLIIDKNNKSCSAIDPASPEEIIPFLEKNKFDLILSDIAPNTTGHQTTDHLRMSSIIEDIISVLDLIALPSSSFVFKIWKGSEEIDIINKLKKKYKKVSYFKPQSSRTKSSEIFIVAQKFIH